MGVCVITLIIFFFLIVYVRNKKYSMEGMVDMKDESDEISLLKLKQRVDELEEMVNKNDVVIKSNTEKIKSVRSEIEKTKIELEKEVKGKTV